MPETTAAAAPILIQLMQTAASTRHASAIPATEKRWRRCEIRIVTARSSEPCGPCSARRWPKTTPNDATHST